MRQSNHWGSALKATVLNLKRVVCDSCIELAQATIRTFSTVLFQVSRRRAFTRSIKSSPRFCSMWDKPLGFTERNQFKFFLPEGDQHLSVVVVFVLIASGTLTQSSSEWRGGPSLPLPPHLLPLASLKCVDSIFLLQCLACVFALRHLSCHIQKSWHRWHRNFPRSESSQDLPRHLFNLKNAYT